jgi:hypothetical protein
MNPVQNHDQQNEEVHRRDVLLTPFKQSGRVQESLPRILARAGVTWWILVVTSLPLFDSPAAFAALGPMVIVIKDL